MKFQEDETIAIASTVKDVLEGKAVKKEEVKYPHKMYHPETGEAVEVKTKAEHEKYSKLGYTHEKPKLDEVEEPRAKGEKDFKDKHVVKKSGENPDGTVTKEEKEDDEEEKEEAKEGGNYKKMKSKSQNKSFKGVRNRLGEEDKAEKEDEKEVEEAEMSSKQKKYKKVFDAALKKFGVKSPAELQGEKKKEFFDYVDKNYDAGENEED